MLQAELLQYKIVRVDMVDLLEVSWYNKVVTPNRK